MASHTTMGYISLRRQVFSYEIKHLHKQIKQFMMLAVFFLGTAIPALFFAALLAFGIVLDNESSVSQLLFISWALLMTQNMMLMLFKQAILGSRYGFFVASFHCRKVKPWLCDIGFAMLCNPILILYLFVIGSIEPQDWPQIPHGFVLLYLLSSGMLMSLYKPQSSLVFLGLALIVIPIVNEQSLLFGLFMFCCCQLASLLFYYFRVQNFMVINILLPAPLTFWLSLARGSKFSAMQTSRSGHKHNTLLIACSMATLVTVMASYSAHQLPQYSLVVHAIGGSFIILATASLQLSIRKIIALYPLFFKIYLDNPSFSRLQYWVSAAATFIMLFIAAAFFKSMLVIAYLIPAAVCILIAQKYPRIFIITWITTSVLTGLLLNLAA
ncbi:MAG: hypothetical protein ACJAVV_000781 [Alphaproteobacteria bacterium]|jgi:hypothetical protein